MCFNCNHRREVWSHHPPRQAIWSSLVPSTGRSWRWWGSRSTTPKILRMHILWLVWLVLYFFLACGYMVLRELLCIILYFFWGVTQIWVIQKTWKFTFHLRDLHLDSFIGQLNVFVWEQTEGGIWPFSLFLLSMYSFWQNCGQHTKLETCGSPSCKLINSSHLVAAAKSASPWYFVLLFTFSLILKEI